MTLNNPQNIAIAEAFIRCYGDTLNKMFPDSNEHITFLPLPDNENEYRDIIVRLNRTIYLSDKEIGLLGLSSPEIFAAIAHELGHIIYNTNPWFQDAEQRADTLAAELGLGSQMIAVIEKIIASRRFRHITSALVQRIQYLSHFAHLA